MPDGSSAILHAVPSDQLDAQRLEFDDGTTFAFLACFLVLFADLGEAGELTVEVLNRPAFGAVTGTFPIRSSRPTS
jgi:hypothetical protein